MELAVLVVASDLELGLIILGLKKEFYQKLGESDE